MDIQSRRLSEAEVVPLWIPRDQYGSLTIDLTRGDPEEFAPPQKIRFQAPGVEKTESAPPKT